MSTVAQSPSQLASGSPPALDPMLLQAARLWIAHHRPYYASILYRCPIVESEIIPTFAVDKHWRIYINPRFANALSVSRFGAILIHELNHLIRDHSARSELVVADPEEDFERWNIASDAEINDDLIADGLDLNPKECITPGLLGLPDDNVAEYYFTQLREPHYSQPKSSTLQNDPQCGSGSGGEALEGELPAQSEEHPGVSAVEAKLVRDQVARETLKHHRQHGNVPGGLVDWATEICEPKVDWRRVLDGMIRHAVATVAGTSDYSYRRFSRRGQASDGIRFPGMIRHNPSVAVVVDTSGSMTGGDIDSALSEVQGILRSASVADDCVTVLTVDAQIGEIATVTDARQVRRMGRGGTDMRVGIDAAVALRPRPHIIVVLTDGFTPWPNRPPAGIRLIVGIVGSSNAQARPSTPEWATTVMIE
jgi:predicted metal-dependent peptidase